MRTHNKTMRYLGAVVLVISAASPAFAQQTGPSCVAEIAQARAQIARALAAYPTIVDPNGPNSGAGRALAGGLPTPAAPGCDLGGPAGCWPANRALAEQIQGAPNSGAGYMTPSITGDNNPSGAGRALAGGFPTPADPLGPNSGAGRALAEQIQGAPNSGAGYMTPSVTGDNNPSGAGRELAAARGRIQQAQALVDAAQKACDAGDTTNAVAKARQAVRILQ